MNLFEMLFFLLAVFISFLLGRYFFGHIGWWSVLPAGILGFGVVWLFLLLLNKLPRTARTK
jgi:hypothetical protein